MTLLLLPRPPNPVVEPGGFFHAVELIQRPSLGVGEALFGAAADEEFFLVHFFVACSTQNGQILWSRAAGKVVGARGDLGWP